MFIDLKKRDKIVNKIIELIGKNLYISQKEDENILKRTFNNSIVLS